MARRRRGDYRGAWHHVFNRGIAKRPLFESAEDIALFLAVLEHVVSIGLIEVHAFCLLTTHFHLLVRSLTADLSEALRLLQNAYVRAYNRSRKRDGPLVRGRFGSRLVEDSVYWETVVRYIDRNAVRAGLCELPSDYPHSSAHAYRWTDGPDWLTRDLVEAVVREANNVDAFQPSDYDAWSLCTSDHVVQSLIDLRPRPCEAPRRFDQLVRGASAHQQSWMEFKTNLADAGRLGTVLVAPTTALSGNTASSSLVNTYFPAPA